MEIGYGREGEEVCECGRGGRGGHGSNMAHLVAVGAFTKYGVKAHSASGQASQPLQEEDRASHGWE